MNEQHYPVHEVSKLHNNIKLKKIPLFHNSIIVTVPYSNGGYLLYCYLRCVDIQVR